MNWVLAALLIGALVAASAVVIGFGRLSRHTPTRDEIALGLTEGRLTPCPDSPNCVSTQASPNDKVHYVEPVTYSGERSAVRERVLDYLSNKRRTTIIHSAENYVHAEVRSLLFRFVDDLEIYLPDEQRQVHVRSASRVGGGDMGVNRKRFAELRQVITAE